MPSQDAPLIPANLTAPCPELSPLDDKTGAGLLAKLIEVSEQYYQCKARHRGLSEAVRKR